MEKYWKLQTSRSCASMDLASLHWKWTIKDELWEFLTKASNLVSYILWFILFRYFCTGGPLYKRNFIQRWLASHASCDRRTVGFCTRLVWSVLFPCSLHSRLQVNKLSQRAAGKYCSSMALSSASCKGPAKLLGSPTRALPPCVGRSHAYLFFLSKSGWNNN